MSRQGHDGICYFTDKLQSSGSAGGMYPHELIVALNKAIPVMWTVVNRRPAIHVRGVLPSDGAGN